MGRFILARLAQFPLILAVIYVLTFLLAWWAPGSPFERNERKVSPEVLATLQEKFHAKTPLQFLTHYPWQLLHGDFGPSMAVEGVSVNEILRSALPVSVTLGLFAMTIATFVGIAVGTLAAVRRAGLFDMASLAVVLIGISVPNFVIASLEVSAATGRLGWFSIGSWGSVRDLVLPGLALSLPPMAYIARLTRVSMLDVLGNDYVRTARAKGLSRAKVIWSHCLRNAFVPVLSYLGPAAADTLTGSFFVEKVFNIPGLGQHFVNSVLNRDQTLILGTVMVYSFFLLTFNLLVDLSYALVDPRIDITARAALA